ncbi:MAG: hypothetical protein O3B24_07745, partial [Verrucomicrobia bacterium]|nr:hypothetical protein [Verrucomicrobiota bacterium]
MSMITFNGNSRGGGTIALMFLLGTTHMVSAALARPDFSHYDVILQRHPFGVVTAAPVVAAPVVMPPTGDSFIKNLRMCAITEAPDGPRVGLLDLSNKPPKSYFLYVGDVEDGIELVEADYVKERAKLRKGSEEHWISMSDASGAGSAVMVGTVAANPAVAGANAMTTRRLSYAERLRKRREGEEERMRELAARPQLAPAELEKSLQNYQLEVIRKG